MHQKRLEAYAQQIKINLIIVITSRECFLFYGAFVLIFPNKPLDCIYVLIAIFENTENGKKKIKILTNPAALIDVQGVEGGMNSYEEVTLANVAATKADITEARSLDACFKAALCYGRHGSVFAPVISPDTSIRKAVM